MHNPDRERHYKLLQSMLYHQVMVERTPLVEKVSLDDELYILLHAFTSDEELCNRILKTLPYPRLKISYSKQDSSVHYKVFYYVPSE